MTGLAITATGLRKVFRLYNRPMDRLKEMFLKRSYHNEFVALEGITFRVKHGRTFGIIGENGAGKSTLLKIFAGTLKPSAGEVAVNGRVSSLLELGSGFHPEFTGMENIYFYGSLLGISGSEMKDRIEEIVSFADIGEYVDYPLKTYSSGMYVRLAFSVAMAIDPDILIVDEALSVGDLYFQKKSTDKILSIKEKGKTILFCSHSMYYVNRICDEVIWLKNGRIAMQGPAHDVTQAYETYQMEKERQRSVKVPEQPVLQEQEHSFFLLRNLTLTPHQLVRSGSDLNLEMEIEALDDAVPYRLAAILFRVDGMRIVGVGTEGLDPFYGSRKISLSFPSLQLKEGTFFLRVFVMDEQFIHKFDTKDTQYFTVPKESIEPGFISLPHRWVV